MVYVFASLCTVVPLRSEKIGEKDVCEFRSRLPGM